MKSALFSVALIAAFSIGLSLSHVGKSPNEIAPRIVDGSDAESGEFPSLVSIICGDDLLCGGALIDPKWVLTSAYCVYYCYDDMDMIVQLGSVKLRGSDFNRVEVTAKEGFLHPGYDVNTFWDNIALVSLANAVEVTDAIKPIALYQGEFLKESDEITITGWGSTDPGEAFDESEILQYGTAIVQNQEECEPIYGFATNTTFCTNSGAAACWKDYGSPAIVTNANGEQTVAGIFAYKKDVLRCVEPENYPGLFTRVDFYVDWIRNVTGIQDL